MKVRYSPRAVGDLIEIGDYLSERSPAGARSVEAKIRATVQLLADFPDSGRSLEQRPQVRVIPVVRFPYLVFYTVVEDELFILHIRHGARAPIDPNEL
jgi:plasmid stabilization system protein ParE